MDGETSNSVSVLSGVPQKSSVLGLLLFIIYIGSIMDEKLYQKVHAKLQFYADDVLLYRSISSINEKVAIYHQSFSARKNTFLLLCLL